MSLTTDELKQLATVLDGYVETDANDVSILTFGKWYPEDGSSEFMYTSSQKSEEPDVCFAMLDWLEQEGWYWEILSPISGWYKCSASKQRDPGFTCAIHVDTHRLKGTTRTEAVGEQP